MKISYLLIIRSATSWQLQQLAFAEGSHSLVRSTPLPPFNVHIPDAVSVQGLVLVSPIIRLEHWIALVRY